MFMHSSGEVDEVEEIMAAHGGRVPVFDLVNSFDSVLQCVVTIKRPR